MSIVQSKQMEIARSQRSTGTVEAMSVVGASPGPISSPIVEVHHKPAAERSARYHNSSPRLIDPRQKTSSRRHTARPHIISSRREPTPVPVIVSERVAIGISGGTASSLRPPTHKRSKSPISATVSSASDLSVIRSRRHRERSSHRHRERSHSRSHRQRHHSRKVSRSRSRSRSKNHSPPKNQDCGRCKKPLVEDPLDPAMMHLSEKKRERVRLELIRRIQQLKKNNPGEDIQLPDRGIRDAATCYRRYRRIARHLYAKRSIHTYRIGVFVFTLIVQMAMSILFGPSAADYLKREYDEIAKYDGVFYEMGCRAYSPGGEGQSPEYRFAWQLVMPILMVAGTYLIARWTPVPQPMIGIATNMASQYLKSGESSDYRTLLHDDDLDEPECDDDNEEDYQVNIPDLEAELPSHNPGTAALQAAVPSMINMITSLRALPEGTAPADGSGIVGTLMGLAQAFMGGNKPAPAPVPVARTAAPAMYDE
jgi:hypothetical protein